MSDFQVLRRIAERGLKAAQFENSSQQIDCWQHMLDELIRAEKLYNMDTDERLVDVEITLDDDILFDMAMEAHARKVTLNHHLVDCITRGLELMEAKEKEDGESND